MQKLRRDFELFQQEKEESVIDYCGRVQKLANDMKANGETVTESKIVEEILRTLLDTFNYKVVAIEECRDLSTMTIDDLPATLEAHEQRIEKNNDSRASSKGSSQSQERQ